MPMIAIRYDLRHPDWVVDTPVSARYRACIEQCRWADRLGLDSVVISEHHGAPDGFMSAPFTLAAAIIGSTARIPVTVAAALAPFHDPVRLAEQMITIDLIGPGRLLTVLGTGYRAEEFEMAGIEFADRWQLFEEAVATLRGAFSGQPFQHCGREVVVTPPPATPGGPLLLMGGNGASSARRAARLHLGFFAADANTELAAAYEDEAQAVGFEHGFCQVPAPLGFVHVSDDPERDWERIMPHAMHEAMVYGSWQRPGQHSAVAIDGEVTPESIRASSVYKVLTADECVEFAEALDPAATLLLHPMMGGLAPDIAWESLERFEHEVLPRIRPSRPSGG